MGVIPPGHLVPVKTSQLFLGPAALTGYFGLLCCAGNLSLKATKEDLARHFGLDSTPYLRSSSWIELAVERPGASQGFGFINVPEHLAGKC